MKPIVFSFGIRVDGRVIKAGYLSAKIAEAYAKGLFGKGYATVEVIDLVTRRCIKRVIPETV